MSLVPSTRRRSLARGFGLVALAALAAAGCGSDGESRSEVVGAMTDVRVPARYDELAASATELVGAVESSCASDQGEAGTILGHVGIVRDQWAALRPFAFGPAMDRRSRTIIDWPVDEEGVRSLAAGDAPVDATSLRELVGSDKRGLGAIEVLAADGPDEDRTCAYLVGAATLVAEETAALASAWDTFGATLSVDAAAANDALSDIVSESLFALPLAGSDNPWAAAQLAGVRWAMLGDGDAVEGIAPLLGEDVIDQVDAEFAAVGANPSFDTVMALERTIKTNVVGGLGITVKFSDADGDG